MGFGQPISDDLVLSADGPTIAGTTTIDGSAVDMSGYSGVLFIVRLGTPAANNTIRVQQDTDSGMGAAADLVGTLVAAGANNLCAIEVVFPGGPTGERYVRCRVTRGTSTTIDSILAIRFGARSRPTAMPSGVSFESWIGPAEGTA
jgi:hypothetical protein